MTTHRYEVIVGNVGTVYDGDVQAQARRVYSEYRKLSRQGYGRVAGEGVTLFKDGDIVAELLPKD